MTATAQASAAEGAEVIAVPNRFLHAVTKAAVIGMTKPVRRFHR
ncbi:hypothetical protein [Defluviimonas sp. SAOS-178_SWC]